VADPIPYCDLSIIASAAIFAAYAFDAYRSDDFSGGAE
jgi:hypothetical protein